MEKILLLTLIWKSSAFVSTKWSVGIPFVIVILSPEFIVPPTTKLPLMSPFPLTSILLEKVVTPVMLTLSKFV